MTAIFSKKAEEIGGGFSLSKVEGKREMTKMVCTLLIGLSLIAAGAIETQIQEHQRIERTVQKSSDPYTTFIGN